MFKSVSILLFAAGASLGSAAVMADADPTMDQVYQAARSGHVDQAQTMMTQVLKDHPNSAKAHYVAAELDARQGKTVPARDELQTAERLEPGLPFARPDAVSALRAELYPQQRVAPVNGAAMAPVYAGGRSGFPWGTALGIGLIVAIVWMIFRRRQQQVVMQGYGGPAGGPYGGGYGNGYPGGGYPPGGGSGLLGSLGTGLAVGAGVVAGEELAHRLLDGNGNRIESADQGAYREPPANPNADMGGNDFGVNDPGSWDDGGGDMGGGGGDDSWS